MSNPNKHNRLKKGSMKNTTARKKKNYWYNKHLRRRQKLQSLDSTTSSDIEDI